MYIHQSGSAHKLLSTWPLRAWHSCWRLQLHSVLLQFALISHSGDVLYLPQLEHRKNYLREKKLVWIVKTKWSCSRWTLKGLWTHLLFSASRPSRATMIFPPGVWRKCVQVIVTYMSGTIHKDCRRARSVFHHFPIISCACNGSALSRLWGNSAP